MRKCIGLTSGLACAVVMGSLALAQQERQQERRQEKSTTRTEVRSEQRTRSSTQVRRISTVVGGTVRLSGGTSIGQIEDIVISDSGCIDYVVVSYNDRFVPIPWSVATVQYDDRIILVDIDQGQFDTIPTFTSNEFHVLADTQFVQKVNKSWNVESTRRESSETRRGYNNPDRKGDRKGEDRKSDDRRKDGSDRKADDRTPRKDGQTDRKADDRPAPKGREGDASKDGQRKDSDRAKDSSKDNKKDNDKDKDNADTDANKKDEKKKDEKKDEEKKD